MALSGQEKFEGGFVRSAAGHLVVTSEPDGDLEGGFVRDGDGRLVVVGPAGSPVGGGPGDGGLQIVYGFVHLPQEGGSETLMGSGWTAETASVEFTAGIRVTFDKPFQDEPAVTVTPVVPEPGAGGEAKSVTLVGWPNGHEFLVGGFEDAGWLPVVPPFRFIAVGKPSPA